MNAEFLGYFLAILTMLIYGVYMVPKKLSTSTEGSFTFWMGLGILISSLLIYMLFPQPNHSISKKSIYIAAISGIIWATGTFAYSLSITKIQLTRSTPVKNLSALFGIISGMIFFHEGLDKNDLKIIFILISGLAIILGAGFLSRVGVNVSNTKPLDLKTYLTGIVLALWAALAFSLYTIPMKIAFKNGVTPVDFLFFMSIGIFLGMLLLALWSGWKPSVKIIMESYVPSNIIHSLKTPSVRNRYLAMLSGLGFSIGSLLANYAVKLAGVAVTWPITKNSIVAVLFSVFVLKDVDYKSSKCVFWLGIFLSLFGIILMGLGV